MIQLIIPFKVQKEAIPIAKKAIQKFMAKIRKYEPDTLIYKSFQQEEDDSKFIHFMTFADKNAQVIHQKSPYCKEFVQTLSPLCTDLPKAYTYHEITLPLKKTVDKS